MLFKINVHNFLYNLHGGLPPQQNMKAMHMLIGQPQGIAPTFI